MPAKSAAISTFATCSFGSILPDNDWVRVNAQLIDAPINASLWAERFDNLGGDHRHPPTQELQRILLPTLCH